MKKLNEENIEKILWLMSLKNISKSINYSIFDFSNFYIFISSLDFVLLSFRIKSFQKLFCRSSLEL
jgi:hypothetical protein